MNSGPNTNAAVNSANASSEALRQLAVIATNVAVLTALLVYFGWRRMETQAARIGIDQDIFGYSTRDYLLRSVGPVLQLLAVVAFAGLAAVGLDRVLRRRAQKYGADDRLLKIVLLVMSACWLLLPLAAFILGYVAPAFAFVAFPLTIAAGVLLFVHASHFRAELHASHSPSISWRNVERISVVLALCVTAFWATSNYAEVLGSEFADAVINDVGALTPVTVYSPQQLAIFAPGTRETVMPGATQMYHYRYTGLRLLTHTSGRYFLVSDLWRPGAGAIIVLGDSSPLRFEFGPSADD